MREFNVEKVTYQEQLRNIRENLALTPKQFSSKMGIRLELLTKLESGARKPVTHRWFYEQLKFVPGVTEQSIEKLLSSVGAPEHLLTDEEEKQPLVVVTTPKGRKVSIYGDNDLFDLDLFDPSSIDEMIDSSDSGQSPSLSSE